MLSAAHDMESVISAPSDMESVITAPSDMESVISAPSDMESDVGRCHKAKSLHFLSRSNIAAFVGGAQLPRASGCDNTPAVAAFARCCR
jgi:hypothetical protein